MGMSLFEIIIGREHRDVLPRTELVLKGEEFDNAMLNYCINLSNCLKSIHPTNLSERTIAFTAAAD